jgi:uroporphyrinogen decarboxylase
MPDFDNFRKAVLCQGEPKRVPQFDGTVAEDIKARFLGKPIRGIEEEIEFCMKAGYDYVPLTLGFRQTIRGEKGGIMGTKQLETSLLKPVQAQYNPREKEKSTRMWAEEGTGQIHDDASFEAFNWPDPDTAYSYDTLDKLSELLPDGAKVIVNVGYIFMAPWMLMGLENFCMALAAEDPVVDKVIDRVGRTQERVVRNVLEYDCVGAVRMPDDLGHTGGTMVAPKFLRRYIFPWHKRIGQMVHAKGLPYMYHSDGRLYDVIEDLIESGFDALHPCEPASMDIDVLKRKYGDRLCLCGNINLDSTLTLGTPADVEQEVKLRIKTIAPGGGYCCGSSNSIPEYVPYENYLAMIEAIQKYGKYPITLV